MAKKIKENVFLLNATDWNRRLFDSLIPLPDGTSYNTYLIKGSDKTVLIDTVDPTMAAVFVQYLAISLTELLQRSTKSLNSRKSRGG